MDKPLLYSIQDATRLLSVGRSSLYYLIAAGKIRPLKIGRRTLIPAQELQRFIELLMERKRRGLGSGDEL